MNYTLINNVKYVTGLNWEDLPTVNSKALNGEIKKLLKEKNNIYGCKHFRGQNRQIGFAEKSYSGQVSLAIALIKSFDEEPQSGLFIRKIDALNYWVCLINDKNNFSSEFEGIYSDRDTHSKIDEISDLGYTFILEASQAEEIKQEFSLEEYSVDIIEYDFEKRLKEYRKVPEDTILELRTGNKQIIKKSIQIGVLILAVGAGYKFVYEIDPLYQEILDQEYSSDMRTAEQNYKNKTKASKVNQKQEEFSNLGKKFIVDKMESNVYTKQEIFQYMKDINEKFPLYLVEWQFDNFEYTKNPVNNESKFTIYYKKIQNSTGYYDEAKRKLQDIIKNDLKPLRYNVVDVFDNGDTIAFDVYFKEPKITIIENMEEKRKKADEEKTKIEQEINQNKDAVASLEGSVEQLGFYDKRFGSALEDIKDNIETTSDSVKKSYKKLLDIEEGLRNKKIEVPSKYIVGSRNELINLGQKNPGLNWRNLEVVSIPDPRNINNNGNAKDKEVIKPFAKELGFEISSQSEISSGIDNSKTAIDLISKSWINISSFNYKIDDETWKIKGEGYEEQK